MALEGRIELFISARILDEIRRVTSHHKMRTKLKLRDDRIDALLENLPKAATLMPVVPDVWTYERDPDDAHYVNLALASHSRLIVSRDKDLLDLMDGVTPESLDLIRRYPDFSVLTPNDFLADVARSSGP